MTETTDISSRARALLGNERPEILGSAALLLFAAALPFSVTFIQGGILLLAAAGIWAARGKDLVSRLRTAPLLLPWAIYLGAGVLTSALGVCPGKSLKYINSDVFTIIAYFTLYLFMSPRIREKALDLYIAMVTLAAVHGIIQAVIGLYAGINLRAGSTSHPVRFGEIMVIGLTLILSRILYDRGPASRKWPLYLSGLLVFCALVLSQTRGAYLGIAFAGCTAFVFDKPSRGRLVKLALLGAALTAALSLANPSLRYRVTSIFKGAGNAIKADSKAADMAINTRIVLWSIGAKMVKDRPMLGSGPGSVKLLFDKYCGGVYPQDQKWGSLHNLYLHHAAERGLLGLGALLLLFLAMLKAAWGAYTRAPSPLTLWAFSLMPGWFVMNVTEISFQHVHTSYAVLLALVVCFTASPGEAGRHP